MWAIPTGASWFCLKKKKKTVPVLSLASRKPVRISQSGRAGNRGVTTLLTLTSSSTLDRSRYLRSQISSGYIATRLHRHSASMPRATLLTLTISSTLDRSRYLRSQISSGCIATQLHRHSASAPGATLLTLTSSSTLDRSCYLRSQISSGYITTRLHRHFASAPGAMLLTLTSSSTLDRSRYLRIQISLGYIATRLHRHSATLPLGLSARSHVAHLDEFVYSGQVLQSKKSVSLMKVRRRMSAD